ncbi:uncharacterized protein LOC124271506 [Haliotis rubra]|uniref:uncharacterized protein LOC124271506 n=1 Tax=Haliotis rubra TaxID=36100 RepID=UPI001EE53887|nr:uncharacterized protein LOC124271506 [Haliotis rubra]
MSQNNSSGSAKQNKRRHVEALSSDDDVSPTVVDSWPKFIVIAPADGDTLKLNPFAISKGIQGICGDVKNVTRLRGGSLLVECALRQQSVNLLSLKQFVNTKVVVSVHKTLNSTRGIIRDRARCLTDMSEEEIAAELKSQGVTAVKRFTKKQHDGTISKTNTYLFTFSLSVLPKSIKAGYFNISVEVYIPNPLRCYNCQKFGHGSKFCRGISTCFRCGGAHESSECTDNMKCVNCGGQHMASSKSCPIFLRETSILKIKHTNNITYQEAKKLVPSIGQNLSTKTYSAAISSPALVTKVPTVSVSCQTVISWLKTDHIQVSELTQVCQSEPVQRKVTSSSQTDSQPIQEKTREPQQRNENDPHADGKTHLTSKEKKQAKKARAHKNLEIASPTTTQIEVHNTFDPLEMDVSPSLPIHGNKPPSRSRSPISPP